MKKLITITFDSIFTFGFSQEEKPIETTTTTTTTTVSTSTKGNSKVETFSKKNELRIDGFYLIFAGALNVSYERVISTESGAGVTMLISSGNELNTKFAISPYYRYYFGKKPATGFYFEGFAMYSSFNAQQFIRNNNNFFFNETTKVTLSDLALGFGLGGKWMTNNGIVFELGFGVGRNLLNDYSNFESGTNITGKGGISIGYRF